MRITTLFISALCLLLQGCNSTDSGNDESGPGENTTIDQVIISSQYYPSNFQTQLQNNLNYFIDGKGVSEKTLLPFDNIQYIDGNIKPANYTNISTIGLYLNLLVEMYREGNEKAWDRIDHTLTILEKLDHWNGLFYWLYSFDGANIIPGGDSIVSAVDNGNLAFSLATLVGAATTTPELQPLASRSQRLLNDQIDGWYQLYDPEKNQLRAGYKVNENDFLTYYIDRKSNESRLASLWAILITRNSASGQIPPTAFTDLPLVQGRYTYQETSYYPMLTWDGSYFQALLPSIWLDERAMSPSPELFDDLTAVHKAYSQKHNIPFVSAASTTSNGYHPFGLDLVSEAVQVFNHEGKSQDTGTPHATALLAIYDTDRAVEELLAIENAHNPETPAGWRDAIDIHGNRSDKIIGLDQGMISSAFISRAIHKDIKAYLELHDQIDLVNTLYLTFEASSVVDIQ